METSEVKLESVGSTMDAAKSLAERQDFLLVSADAQTNGKGTRGRPWQSHPGNIYMTLGINRRHLPPGRLGLLPLEMGLHLWDSAAAELPAGARSDLALKWPNDLLLRGAKAAGILMESYGEFLLVGIGINVAGAPMVEDGGTPSACLAAAGMALARKDALVDDLYLRVRSAPRTAEDYDAEAVLVRWQGKVDWRRAHAIRDRPGTPMVLPLAVNRHGHLQVEHGDGSREWLVSEYLA
jgi:BirA family biotin operon repressor/biotin-[acetyl-CoA-carboxylase] ligase